MMKSSVITPSSETRSSSKQPINPVITLSAKLQSKVTGSLQNLPVVVPATTPAVPDSFIGLFWQMTGVASKGLKDLVKQGISLWVEAFSTMASVQQIETATPIYPTQLSPAFRLRSEDAEASLVSSLIAERRFNTAVQPLQTAERDAWLSANQWAGLDDLFPMEQEPTESLLPQNATDSVTNPKEAVTVAPLVSSTVVTASTILEALHEAYPISTPEEEACLKHPLIQRGREVKSNINQLVDAYFASEELTD